ncbi:MAG: LamG-like jellyroll fold domain-containing protein, partial [Planctomycetota bacterium]
MCKKLLYLMTFVVLLGLLAAPAIATTYYVDQDHANADDSNAGTSESAPWETLRKATQTADAGDTVYVKAGTYIDTVEPNHEDKFEVVNNGTAANPITFISSPQHAAVVRSESLPSSRNDYAWGIGEGAEYIIIDGFKIEGGIVIGYDGASHCTIRNCEVIYGRCPDSDSSLNWGLTVYGADYCTIENNYVHNMTYSGYSGHNSACIMVFVDSDYNIIQGNTADANNGIVFSAFGQKGGQMDDNIWRYNLALNATAGFLGMGSTSGEYPTQDNIYYQNIIIDCDRAFFFDHRAERFVMYNNTAVDCDWFLGASKIDNIDTEMWNNILVGTDDIAIRWSGYPTAEPFSTLIEYSNYNCFYNCSKIAYREKSPSLNYYTLNDWETATGFDPNSITSDPCLVGGGDYSLDTGSPCIDAGVDLQDYDDDQNTTESINMGAYITGNETIGHDWGTSAPTKATSPSPANSAASVSTTADLSWTAGSGSTSSDVYFGTDSTPDSGEFQGNQTATTFDPGTMSNSTTYYWRIDEINANGTTTGDVWSFTTESGASPPGQATSPSPANSATDVNVTTDLSWTAGSGATSRDVYFGTTSPGTSQGNQTATTFDTGTMDPNTTYYWRIDEVNSAGTTTGTVWSFTTAAGSGETIKINFQPSASQVPSGYEKDYGQVYGSQGNGLSYGWSVSKTSHTRDRGIDSDQRYDTNIYWPSTGPYWEIALDNGTYDIWLVCGDAEYDDSTNTLDIESTTVTDPDGEDYFDEYNFQVDVNDGKLTIAPATGAYPKLCFIEITPATVEPPGQATNPSPSNSATGVSITADLSWTADANATSHDVYFGTTSPGTSQGNQTATTFDTGTMSNNTTYYWRIDEVNAGGTTTGTVWSFTTIVAAPGAASNPNPANSATDVSTTTDLSWTAGAGATSHDVYFGTTSPGASQGNQTATTFDTGTMDNDTTYYWRIDEVNAGGTTTGTVWSFTTEQQATPDANLVGWWRFENNANDSAGTNDGTIYGAVDANGKIGQALSFDEVNDYVTVPDFDYTNDSYEFSLNFWFKIADVAGSGCQYMYSHGNVTADNSLNVYFSEADEGAGGEELRTWIALGDSTDWYSASDPDFVDGQWHMYTITVSSVDGAKIYVDANSILTDPNLKGASMNPASSIYIGARNDLDPNRYYGNSSSDDGLLDDVRLYDRALSQSDVSNLYSGDITFAHTPSPADSATDVSITADLSWTAGTGATSHDVYFGTSSPGA